MTFVYRSIILMGTFLSLSGNLMGQDLHTFWKKSSSTLHKSTLPQQARAQYFTLNQSAWASFQKEIAKGEKNSLRFYLPNPEGEMMEFLLEEKSFLSPQLASKRPDIHIYQGQARQDSRISLRMDWTNQGLHAMVMSPQGVYYLDPQVKGNTENYLVYWRKDAGTLIHQSPSSSPCEGLWNPEKGYQKLRERNPAKNTKTPVGSELRSYRLAVAATGEYTDFHDDGDMSNGNSILDAQSAIITTINRVRGIYEREVGISFILIDNTDIIFPDGESDPFSNDDASNLINQSQTEIDNAVGFANYDIGHTFSTGGGGLAGFGVVCTSSKARGITGSAIPQGDAFDVDFVAHEIGHQFGADHTYNGTAGSCGSNRVSSAAYEPGSGNSIMAYAGICSSHNIELNSDPFFHSHSLDQIRFFSNESSGNNCAELSDTGNTPPEVDAGQGGFYIPIGTPFKLSGSGSDANGDVLSYSWEQFDLGPGGSPQSPSGNAPLFRFFPPLDLAERTFPRMEDIVSNQSTIGEILPTYSRSLNFRLVARDNQIIGGVNYDNIQFNVSEDAGPFRLSNPNIAQNWVVGDNKVVLWEVNNTNIAPVNCQRVNILLSNDGGFTYPVVLAENVPNDGRQSIVVPNQVGTQNRIKVEAADNIFFDISDANFTINAAPNPSFSIFVNPDELNICAPEEANFIIQIEALGAFNNPVNLSLQNLAPGLIAEFSAAQVNPGGESQLNIRNTESQSSGFYNFEVLAQSGNIQRVFPVNLIISNGTPPVTLISPSNEASGVSVQTSFDWEDSPSATSYEVEVAFDPDFEDLAIQTSTNASFFVLEQPLLFSQTYYWRVKALDQCGIAQFSEVSRFQTFGQVCNTYNANDLPLTILPSGANAIRSSINIPDDLEILDINVLNVTGEHTFVSDLTFTLEGPDGTQVVLLSGECGSNEDFALNFDDEALSGSINCPLTGGDSYRPVSALSTFIGTRSIGTWTLIVEDDFNEDGGLLNAWTLEICSGTSGENIAPNIVLNQGLLAEKGFNSYPLKDLLQANDVEDTNGSLSYILSQLPSFGSLQINNQNLGLGDVFSQSNIDDAQVVFSPNNPLTSIQDSFRFRVEDSSRDSSPEARFDIVLNARPELILNEVLRDIPKPNFDLDNAFLQASDEEDNNASLQYILKSLPSGMVIKRNGTILTVGDVFLQSDLNNQNIQLESLDPLANISTSFQFLVQDQSGLESDLSTFIIDINIVNSAEEAPKLGSLQLYPNPSSGRFYLGLAERGLQELNIDVYSAQGQLVLQTKAKPQSQAEDITLDLSSLPKGLYFIKIRSGESFITRRLIRN